MKQITCLREENDFGMNDPVFHPAGKGYEFAIPSDCRKTNPAGDNGGKDSVKENRQGCLSRSINRFFKLF